MPHRLPTRSWLLEISLAALAMLLGLFFVANSVSEGDGAPIALEAVAAVVSFTGLVLFRRTRPVALTLFLIPCGILLGMPMGATPVALFAVALHRPARVAIALAAVHATATAVIYGLVLGLTRAYYESVAFLVLLHVSLIAVAMVIRAHRQLVASWAERVRQAEEGQRLRIEQARLAEREQIAREMHDVLAHRISLLALHAGALSVRRDASDEERQAAGVIRQCAHDAGEDLRSLLGMLRAPAVNRPLPTLDDVPTLVKQSQEAGANVSLSLTGAHDEPETVPDQIGRHAYRIIQEALTNALKHAPGSAVRVNVDVRHMEGLSVHVVNDLGWHRPGISGGDDHADRPDRQRDADVGGQGHPRGGADVARRASPGGDVDGRIHLRGDGFVDRPSRPRSDTRLARSDTSRGSARAGRAGATADWAFPPASREAAESRSAQPPAGRSAAFARAVPGAGLFSGGSAHAGWADRGELPPADPIPGAGAGLIGLRERVQLVGGRLEHGPTASGEFDVKAWLPWHT